MGSDNGWSRRVALLGGGRMGEALASGLLRAGGRGQGELIVTCRRAERADEIAERLGVTTTLSNEGAVCKAGSVVLTVKPQGMEALLEQITGAVTADHVVISFSGGVRTSFVARFLPSG